MAEPTYHLEKAAVERSITKAGDASALLSRLNAGKPISIGILGASVAEQGGCLTQPGKECQRYDGVSMTWPGWGPHRPFMGYLVRFFHWINATWPHAHHSIFNGAQSAKPLYVSLPCLDLYAPQNLDLVVLEPLSSGHINADVERIVRALLSRPRPPVLVFLLVPLWYGNDLGVQANVSRGSVSACNTNRRNAVTFGMVPRSAFPEQPTGAVAASTWRSGAVAHSSTSYSRGEGHMMELCARYGLSCLSMYAALAEGVRAGRPGYSMLDIAGDCLHPMHGTLGTEYVTDVLIHWVYSTAREAAAARASGGANGAGARGVQRWARSAATVLPAPVEPRAGAPVASSACYTLEHAHHGGWLGGDRANKFSLPWYTAACPEAGCSPAQAERARESPTAVECPNPVDRAALARVLTPEGMPHVWMYCYVALNPTNPKRSPGVVALRPGATLYVPLPVGHVGATDGDGVCLSLLYLSSYEEMGIARLRCHRGCACEEHLADAYATELFHGRNASVFREFKFRARVLNATDACVVEARVDERSSSAGHKFKISDVHLQRVPARRPVMGTRPWAHDPCEQDE